VGIDFLQFSLGGNGLGKVLGYILFVKQQLALQIAFFDVVPVDNAQAFDAATDKQVCRSTAQGAAANEGNRLFHNGRLPLASNTGKQRLSRIAV
jgi:hypothetical protein